MFLISSFFHYMRELCLYFALYFKQKWTAFDLVTVLENCNVFSIGLPMVAFLKSANIHVMWAVLYRSGPSSSCHFNSFIRRYYLIISRSCIDECEFCYQKEVIVTDQCCSLYFRCKEIQSIYLRKVNLNTFKMLQVFFGRRMDSALTQ